jgi:hypothetical protein
MMLAMSPHLDATHRLARPARGRAALTAGLLAVVLWSGLDAATPGVRRADGVAPSARALRQTPAAVRSAPVASALLGSVLLARQGLPTAIPPAVICPPITLSPLTLPAPAIGVAYSQTFTASGGIAPYTYVVATGSLPPGLALSSSSGVLSGIPTTSGTFTFSVLATDVNGCFVEVPFTMTVPVPVPALPPAVVVLLVLGLTAMGYLRLRQPRLQ